MLPQHKHICGLHELYISAEWTVEFEALWMWDWDSHYGHDKENSNAATGSQTLVIQSVADYFNDSYQTGKVNIVLIVFPCAQHSPAGSLCNIRDPVE